MKSDKLKRFSGAVWANNPQEILIIGTGGVGAILSLFLARQEHKLTIFDDDTIDLTNIGGQLFKTSQVGHNKVDAVYANNRDFCGDVYITNLARKWVKEDSVQNITISCADDMNVRRNSFEAWLTLQNSKTEKNPNEVNIFIDARMGMTHLQIFAITKGSHIEAYKKTLFNNEDVDDIPCNMKATTHCGAIIAGLITSIINNQTANKILQFPVYEVPFSIDFNLDTFEYVQNK